MKPTFNINRLLLQSIFVFFCLFALHSIAQADIIEEIARVYGYDNIPETRMADALPPQSGNQALDREEHVRDLLVTQGLQEIVSYRFTTPERESRRLRPETPPDDNPYLRIANPIAPDKAFLRHSVLASVLEAAERNARVRDRLALFEIGPAFLASEAGDLPDELQRIAILLAGPRSPHGWQPADTAPMDFYDLKGIITTLLEGLHILSAQSDSIASARAVSFAKAIPPRPVVKGLFH